MFAETFKLKKSSWHLSLMKWIWGYDSHDFYNLCPYFWLTILNLFIAPFVGSWVVFKTAVWWLRNKVDDFCAKQEENWVTKYLDKLLQATEPQPWMVKVYDSTRFFGSHSGKYETLGRRLYNYRYGTLEEQALYKKLVAGALELQAEYDAAELKIKDARAKTLTKLVKIIKPIVLGLVVIAVAVILYLLYRLGVVASRWPWLTIGEMVLRFIGYLALVGIAVLILAGAIIAVKTLYCEYCVSDKPTLLGATFKGFGSALAAPFVYIGKGFAFVWAILVAMKQNNCPGIDWE